MGYISFTVRLISLQARSFSQMKNLVGLCKVLVCEIIDGSPTYRYFYKTHLFTTLDLFIRPDGDWVCKPFSFFTDEKLWLTKGCVTHEKQHQIFAGKF